MRLPALTSDEAIVSINVISANGQPVVFVGNDPLHPGQSALFVFGTSHDDHIEIESRSHGKIEVEIDSAGVAFRTDLHRPLQPHRGLWSGAAMTTFKWTTRP